MRTFKDYYFINGASYDQIVCEYILKSVGLGLMLKVKSMSLNLQMVVPHKRCVL